ncbi:hypothetical protein JTB14_017981 [Gonioctena quinquepunctata]|nr:hypothetical protein JTB14_017981 [Gonioctena quinquepunctata]
MIPEIFTALTRRKRKYDEEPSQLARVMNLLDLVGLGIGSALGLGLYVLAGSLAKNTAGPATCLSFLAAAFISLPAGLCYAETAAKVPRAGYAYTYSYVAIGEFVAFIIGWNIIVGCILGAASAASAISKHIDSMTNKTVERTLLEWMPMNIKFLAPYPDFLSTGIMIFFTILLSIGMKNSKQFNNICTTLNLLTVITAVVACLTKVDINNWKISVNDIDDEYRKDAGDGGFFPFGISGVLAAIPNCFFGFTGFETPSLTSEEAKNPKKDIPIAIMISLISVLITYFILSAVLTLVWPYYLQS